MMKNFMKNFITFYDIIVVMAIIWYLFTSFEVMNKWWALPSFIIGVGLSLLITALRKRIPVVNAITFTGITLLCSQMFFYFCTSKDCAVSSSQGGYVGYIFAIFIATLIYDLSNCNNIQSVVPICIDISFSVIAALLILLYLSNPLLIVLATFIIYILVIIIDVDISFKRFHEDEEIECGDESINEEIE